MNTDEHREFGIYFCVLLSGKEKPLNTKKISVTLRELRSSVVKERSFSIKKSLCSFLVIVLKFQVLQKK